MYKQIMSMVLAPINACIMPIWGQIAAAVAPTVVGSLMGGGGGGSTGTQQAQQQLRNISGGGLFDTTGQGQVSLTPEMQALQQQLLGQAAGSQFGQQAGALGQQLLGQVGSTDPFEMAQTQFGRMEDILAPQRDQQRLAQESRLFSQGRLGSTGGSLQQQALEGAFSQQQAQNLAQALGQAQNIQGQQIERGAFLGQLPQSMQTQALNSLLGIQSGAMQQMGQTTLGGRTTTGTTPGVDPLQTIGTGLMTSGAKGLQSGIEGLFTQPQQQSTNQMIQGQTGYTGGYGGVLSGDEWRNF